MPTDLLYILTVAATAFAGAILGLFVLKPKKLINLNEIKLKSERILQKATTEAENTRLQGQERLAQMMRKNVEYEEKIKLQSEKIEKLIVSKEEQLEQKSSKNNEYSQFLQKEEENLKNLESQNKALEEELKNKLLQKTGLAVDAVRADLLNDLDRDLELAREDRLHKYEEYLKEDRARLAKNLITAVIQLYSAPTSVDKKGSSISVQRDEAKGRLLGTNGENLFLLEELTGVDIIFNDSPDTIIVSCFDLVRRHIAREAINKLLKERIINPDKIRQKIEEAKLETEKTLIAIGRDTVKMLGLGNRNFTPEFMRIVGRLKFRTSYGQNILKHSFEVGYFTLMLGGELGLDMTTSKIGGFFHDLGKAIDQEVGGSHDVLTKEIMEKHGFSDDEIHAAWAHHDAIPQRTAEAMLVKAGDAISAGRPGARQESLEKYIERINAIQDISTSYEGVSKAFAISAGREVRVLVEPQTLKDEDLPYLAQNIAEEIQQNVAYPGKIKINVIRRSKNIDYAKIKGKAGVVSTNQ